jgi:hypothetical protein
MKQTKYSFIKRSYEKLKSYCENENFKGWDPYDGLNSKIFKSSPLKHNRLSRLLWIQLFKKNPINLRPFFLVSKGYNPKGIGLFLSAYCNLYNYERNDILLKKIKFLADKLLELKTNAYSGDCWGYNFDWQSRLEFMPDKTPTIVATSFVGYSLLDAFDLTGDERFLNSALSSCDFIEKDLNRTNKNKGFIFSYSPLDQMRVYNASLLGSRLLARAYRYSENERLIDLARSSVVACADKQREDGAWYFGENKVQRFIDSFHTGYKLESIAEYQKYSGDNSFKKHISRGAKFYLENFFLDDGLPKYYENNIYPIDIHCPAQFIATLSRLNIFHNNIELAEKVLIWTIRNMQNEKNGYFYYQINKTFTSKIPYIRWAQAWMLYGMSFYLREIGKDEKEHCRQN